jgi:hypothetical protein
MVRNKVSCILHWSWGHCLYYWGGGGLLVCCMNNMQFNKFWTRYMKTKRKEAARTLSEKKKIEFWHILKWHRLLEPSQNCGLPNTKLVLACILNVLSKKWYQNPNCQDKYKQWLQEKLKGPKVQTALASSMGFAHTHSEKCSIQWQACNCAIQCVSYWLLHYHWPCLSCQEIWIVL